MSRHRSEILRLCVSKMKNRWPERSDEELGEHLPAVVDDIIRALRKDAGLLDTSPLPGRSEAAAAIGRQRQHRGYYISTISFVFGGISDTIGELASKENLSFSAQEYRVFNQCVDTSFASAVDEYWKEARAQQEHQTAQRVGFLAHELRNTLSTARNAFEVLKTGQIGIRSRTGEIVDRALTRMQDLISQTLLATQIEAGLQPQLRRMRVEPLLRDIEAAAIPERNISVTLEIDASLELDADERLLISAVSNLLQNALKFSRDGGQVVLRARAEQGYGVIEVEDECGGLPPGDPAALFVPFAQSRADRWGAGLGLAITREAVELQGGEVYVRNLPGKGCIFALKLPAVSEAGPEREGEGVSG